MLTMSQRKTLVFDFMISLHTGQCVIGGERRIPHSSQTQICLQGRNKTHLFAERQTQHSNPDDE